MLNISCGDWERDGGASEGPAELAVDDNLNTIWHTDWYGTSRENHWFQFELTESYTVDGLRYKPRVAGNTNGIITEFDVQISDDGVNFRSVASGNWAGDRNWKVVEFEGVQPKFVRLVALDAITDNAYVFACAAEIRITGVKGGELPHEHAFGEWTVTREVTCTEDGSRERVCECGEKETEVIAALGHDFVNGKCSRCDAVMDAAFEDVPVGSFYFDPVQWAVDEEITAGTTPTTFDPNGKCMRAVVVTFLWKAAGSPEPETTENPFTDVKEGSYYYKAVLWAYENKVTSGLTATTFGPTALCNRAQVVTFLYNAMGKPEVKNTEHKFTDVDEGKFYYTPMLWAVENGITAGLTETTFGPNAICNRAQVVTFLYRLYNK